MATPTSNNGINANRVSVTDDFNNLKPTSSQEADALKNVQDRVFRQAEGVSRRQGVNVDVPAGSGVAFGPSAPGFGGEGNPTGPRLGWKITSDQQQSGRASQCV